MKKERKPCSKIEQMIANRLANVRYTPASFDKRFGKNIHYECDSLAGITDKQREILLLLFKKYRRQIADYDEINIGLNPDEYAIESEFSLFGLDVKINKTKVKKAKK